MPLAPTAPQAVDVPEFNEERDSAVATQTAEPAPSPMLGGSVTGEQRVNLKKRAAAQAWISERTKLPIDYLEANWENAKSAYAKHDMGIVKDKIPDDEMFGYIQNGLKVLDPEVTGEIKPWTMEQRILSIQASQNRAVGKFWESLNVAGLPRAPEGLPDVNTGGMPMSPAVAGGLYNGVVQPLVTPFNVLTMGTLSELSVAAQGAVWAKRAYQGISGIFAAQMAWGAVNAAPEVKRINDDPKSTPQQKIEAWSGFVANTTFAALAAFGAVHDALPEAKREPVLKAMEGKTPPEAAEVLRQEAVTSTPETADALNKAATHLDEIGTWEGEGGSSGGKEKIAAAAIREESGRVSEGESHDQIVEELGGEKPAGAEEGFVTTQGRFVDRTEAHAIAEEAGQLKGTTPDEAAAAVDKAQNEGIVIDVDAKTGEVLKEPRKAPELHSQQVNYAARPRSTFGQTSLKNAYGDLERVAYGFPEATKTEQRGMAERWVRSGEVLEKDPEAGARLADQLKKNPNLGLSDDQSALLLRHKVSLENALNAAADRARDPNLSPEARAEAQEQAKHASESLLELLNAVRARGTEWGREGRWRQALAHEDYSFATQETMLRTSKGGRELTPEERTTLQNRIDELQAKQRELEEHIAKQRVAPERKARGPVRLMPATARTALANAAATARANIAARFKEGRVQAGLDPQDLADWALVAADSIVTHGEKAAAKMVEIYGDRIKPHIDEVMKRANGILEKARQPEEKPQTFAEEVATDPRGEPTPIPPESRASPDGNSAPSWLSDSGLEAWDRIDRRIRNIAAKGVVPDEGPTGDLLKDLSLVGADLIYHTGVNFAKWSDRMVKDLGEQVRPHLESIFDKAKSIYRGTLRDDLAVGEDSTGPTNLPTVAVKLARSFIEEGMRDRDQIVDAVHSVLKDSEAKPTRRDVIDAISGYGKFKPLTRDEITDQLRDVKGQLLQVAKLEDMAKGEAPKKTGPERRTPSDEERRLIQEVNRQKKEGGYEITDPEKQLRTALQASERAVENRIKDLADRFEKGEPEKPKKSSPTSEELETLRAFKDRVAKIVEQVEGDTKLTPEERIDKSIKSTTKAIEQLEADLQEGKFSTDQTGKAEPWSKELGALRKKLADLRDFREQVRKAMSPGPTPEEKALAGVKTRLEKQIESLEKQIATRTKAPKKAKSPVNLDPEAEALTAQRDALRKEYENIFGRKELTEEQRLNIWKANAERRRIELERRLAEKDFAPKPKRPAPALDKEGIKLASDVERLKQEFAIQRQLAEEAAQPTYRKVLTRASDLARASALSGYHTLAKLAAFSLGKFVETPATEGVGAAIRQIPGVKPIFEKANLETGAEYEGIAKFYAKAATEGMKDAWQTMKTGKSDLKAELGDPRHTEQAVHWWDYFGISHMAEKSPLLRGEFELRLEKGFQWAIANGLDVTDPLVQGAIRKEAFDYAQRAILQENNVVADAVNGFLGRLEKANPDTPIADMNRAAIVMAIRTFVTKGIVRTPANYIKQSFERTPFGLTVGGVKAIIASVRGVEKLSNNEANAIGRLLKIGAVGSAMFLWGVIDSTKKPQDRTFGGYYQPGEKRKDEDVGWRHIRIGNWEAPHLLSHNPLLESAQMGATMGRVMRSKLNKGDQNDQGALAGAVTSLLGLAAQAPIANPLTRNAQALERGEAQKVFWDSVTGLVPQLVQNIAQDLDGKARAPRTLGEAIETTIPGLRENVPTTKSQKKRDVKERLRNIDKR